jgi:hypothetical protein
VRLGNILGLALILLIAAPAFGARTILFYENECCRYITEGEFAILYSQGLRLPEPAQGWTVQAAATALSSLGHQPEGGWVLSRFLSEMVMARLLKNSPFYRKPFTEPAFQRSLVLVTFSRARSVFPPDEGITQGEFAILLAQALKLPSGPFGWTAERAAVALSARSVPLRPASGWNVSEILREAEYLQILAPTQYKPAAVNPATAITTLQAYSLLFGRFEIATEGDFGLFVVKALGVAVPVGGWNKLAALEYIKKEFNIDNGYGWNAAAPLCAEVFENSLRQVLLQVKPTGSAPGIPDGADGVHYIEHSLLTHYEQMEYGDTCAACGRIGGDSQRGGSQPATQAPNSSVEGFLKEVRRSGLIPSDRCAIIPVQGLIRLTTGAPPPEEPNKSPASSSAPPLGQMGSLESET